MSVFSTVPLAPKDPLFESLQKFKECNSNDKMNLTIGMISDPGNEPNLYEFKCVQKAQELISKCNLDKEYPPLTGMPDFNNEVQNFFFGNDSKVVKEGRILTVHTITGGAALTIGANLLKKLATSTIYLSNRTWSIYSGLFQHMEIKYYPYYNEKTKSFDFEAMLKFFEGLEKGSVASIQLNSHNPTGFDLSQEQWKQLGHVCATNKIFVFFDIPYLGYCSGSLLEDFAPVRLFESLGIEMFIAYSSEKNFGNYCDNAGVFMAILNRKELVLAVKSHLIVFCRVLNSFPSLYGSRVILKILQTPELKKQWEEEILYLTNSLKEKRKLVLDELESLKAPLDFNSLKQQQGLYLFIDMNNEQTKYLAEKYNIYVVPGGRIALPCISQKNYKLFASGVADMLTNVK